MDETESHLLLSHTLRMRNSLYNRDVSQSPALDGAVRASVLNMYKIRVQIHK